MQAIITKYYGPTNHRGASVKAICESGSITMEWDSSLDSEENHFIAALALQEKLGWTGGHYGKLVGAGMPRCGYCWVMVPDLASEVIAWATSPGNHGGNPECLPFVRTARRMMSL
jgi:hypothetical protein